MASPKPEPKVKKPLENELAERAVLGAVLVDSRALYEVRDFLEPEDFAVSQHIHIFFHMLALAAEHIPVDSLILTERIERADELELVGGAAYLASLVDGVPRVTNVRQYAQLIKEASILRSIVTAAHKIQLEAQDRERSSVILARARARLNQLAEFDADAGPLPLRKIVEDSFEHVKKIFTEGEHVTGLPTGYTRLDDTLGGLQPSELIVLAARPSVGKSSFAMNIAENIILQQNRHVVFFSLEMSRESLLLRLLAHVAHIDATRMRHGRFAHEDWEGSVKDQFIGLGLAPLWIDDASASTITQIAARAEKLKRDHDIRLVIVDYLQLVVGGRRFANRQEEVADTSRGLKALAKDLAIPVLALAQLSRASQRDGGRPQLSDLRESGAIEQDADVVMFLHRPHLHDEDANEVDRNDTDVIVGKQRNGPIDTVKFTFLPRWTRFEERIPSLV